MYAGTLKFEMAWYFVRICYQWLLMCEIVVYCDDVVLNVKIVEFGMWLNERVII